MEFDRNKILGKGGSGYVYKGTWKTGLWPFLNRKSVAVKRVQHYIQPIQPSNKQKGEEVLKSLDHPNVIKLFHVQDDKDFRHFVLELCVASLDKVFLPEGDPEKYVDPALPCHVEVMFQLASGLDYIHSKNLIHRDIKPANVLIHVEKTDNGQNKVTLKWADFGLSRTVNERGTYEISKLVGTTNWLAPELLQCLDEMSPRSPTNPKEDDKQPQEIRGTVKSDVFAEGCVFACYLGGGVHPYGNNNIEIQKNLRAGKSINLTNIYYHTLLLKMMECEPKDRISSSCVKDEIDQMKIRGRKLLKLCAESDPRLEEINRLIRKGADIDVTNEEQQPPLFLLIINWKGERNGIAKMKNSNTSHNLIETIELFIQHGFNVNHRDIKGINVLYYLNWKYSEHNLIDIVRLLIKQQIDLNCKKYEEGWNALHYWCAKYKQENLIDIVRLLIEREIDVNCKNNEGLNTLHLLCRYYDKENLSEIVQLLIKHKIVVNCKTNEGLDAFHLLCLHYDKKNLDEIVQLLIDHEIDVNYNNNDGWNALLILCRNYDKENLSKIVQLLIKHKIDVNCKTNEGLNALHLLCRYYDKQNLIDIVRLLIENEIDVNCKTNEGLNALHLLCEHYGKENLIDIVRLLIKHKIDVNCKTSDGWNALLFLCRHYEKENLIDIVRLLIENEIDVNCKINFQGWNALLILCRNYGKENLIDIVRLLIEHKIDINYKINLIIGGNVIHYLCEKYKGSNDSLTDIIRLLAFCQEDEEIWKTNSIFNDEAQYFLWERFNAFKDDILKIRALRENGIITIKYDYKKILGQGGFVKVFPGVWGTSRVPVAVKRVKLLDVGTSGTKREEENLQKLKEKPDKIVQLFHVHQDEKFRYFALELCAASLDQLFLPGDDPKKYKGPALPSDLEVLLQLAEGLEYIHSKKMIHRDIKPDNILISVDPTSQTAKVKWSDFGLSRPISNQGTYTITNLAGVDKWMAPELLEQKRKAGTQQPIELRGTVMSDIYAEGLVFVYYLGKGKGAHPEPGTYKPSNHNDIQFFHKDFGELISNMLEIEPEKRNTSLEVVLQLNAIKKKQQETANVSVVC